MFVLFSTRCVRLERRVILPGASRNAVGRPALRLRNDGADPIRRGGGGDSMHSISLRAFLIRVESMHGNGNGMRLHFIVLLATFSWWPRLTALTCSCGGGTAERLWLARLQRHGSYLWLAVIKRSLVVRKLVQIEFADDPRQHKQQTLAVAVKRQRVNRALCSLPRARFVPLRARSFDQRPEARSHRHTFERRAKQAHRFAVDELDRQRAVRRRHDNQIARVQINKSDSFLDISVSCLDLGVVAPRALAWCSNRSAAQTSRFTASKRLRRLGSVQRQQRSSDWPPSS